MTDTTTSSTQAKSPEPGKRPAWSWARGIEWAIWPLIHKYIGPKRQVDGTYPPQVLKLPNQLTLSRLAIPLAAAGFLGAALNHNWLGAAVMLVAIAALFATDAFDGAIARYTGSSSDWGKFWDPVLDKIALAPTLGALLILVYHFHVPLPGWFVRLVIARVIMDAILAIIARTEERRQLNPKSGMWGKIKTTCDILAVLTGYTGAVVCTAGGPGAGIMLAAGGFLALATFPFAPGSIIEHAKNLRRSNRES